MRPQIGKIYHTELTVSLPFPIGKKTANVILYIDSPTSFHLQGSYKDHTISFSGGEINDDVLAIKGEVSGYTGEFCFTIDDNGRINGTATAWKFHDLKVNGKVVAIQ